MLREESTLFSLADVSGDNLSDASSYVHGSHEDVLWSFEQQVRTMQKYGVVANVNDPLLSTYQILIKEYF